MKLTFFSTQPYDKKFFDEHNKNFGFEINYLEVQLNELTAKLAEGSEAVCVFVNDRINQAILEQLATFGIRILALRCAGFNNVDLPAG